MSISATSSVSLSGIQAGFERLHISADNVARHEVVNSEKNRAVSTALAKGGVEVTFQKIPLDPAQRTTDPTSFTATNIDYAEESTNQNVARIASIASMRVFNMASKMEKSLLDIKI